MERLLPAVGVPPEPHAFWDWFELTPLALAALFDLGGTAPHSNT
jgi:hypothetical protein